MTRLMDQDEHTGPINIGNPTEFTMLELAKVCALASNCPTMPAEPPLSARPPAPNCCPASYARAQCYHCDLFSSEAGLLCRLLSSRCWQ